jgi:hypothetical protein
VGTVVADRAGALGTATVRWAMSSLEAREPA